MPLGSGFTVKELIDDLSLYDPNLKVEFFAQGKDYRVYKTAEDADETTIFLYGSEIEKR